MLKLIGILILALAIGMTVPKTRAMIEREATPYVNKFKVKITEGRLKAMADELAVQVEHGEGYPPDWKGWLEGDFTGDPHDPWGHEYYLIRHSHGFVVGSMGPDGIRGTGDDVKLTRKLSGQ